MTDAPAPHSSRPVCPWCSAVLPSAAATACPSCGATLIGDSDDPLPGVTAIDAGAIARGARVGPAPRRSGLLAWITGDEVAEPEQPAPPGSLEPPPPEVRREMLRMALEAEVADLQAEAEALAADARAEGLEGDEQVLEAAADDAAATADEMAAGAAPIPGGDARAPADGAVTDREQPPV